MDQTAAVLFLISSMLAAIIQRIGKPMTSAVTHAMFPLVMLFGSLSGFASLYLFFVLYSWLGLLWWFLSAMAAAAVLAPIIGRVDGVGSIGVIISFPLALFLWLGA